jgi:hypothetical protein
MLPPLASLEALEVRVGQDLVDDHGEPIGADGLRAQAALEDASALVRAQAGATYDDEHDLLLAVIPDVIVSVTLAAAYRAFLNPQGAVQTSVGDVSVTYSRGQTAGAVFLTSAEMRAVRQAAGASSVGSLELETGFIPPNGAGYGRDELLAPMEDPRSDPIPLGPAPWE